MNIIQLVLVGKAGLDVDLYGRVWGSGGGGQSFLLEFMGLAVRLVQADLHFC